MANDRPAPGAAARFGGERTPPPSDSPAHGERTIEVLQELGHNQDAMAGLIEQGVAQPVAD